MFRRVLVVTLAVLAIGGCTASHPADSRPPAPRATVSGAAVTRSPAGIPRLQHLIVVIEENHGYGEIAGNRSAPYLNALMRQGASLASMYAITHPSEPNYVALFSGSTHGLTDDSCPVSFRGPNLATQLLRSGRSFAGYSEGLPGTGYRGCAAGAYVRRHTPWNSFPDVPRSADKPLSAMPSDYSKLPTVSFVIPNLEHDMHDGTIAQADTWLRSHLGRYVTWARAHDSALIVTWDEDDFTSVNKIATVIVGAHVPPMRLRRHADLYRLLRTIEWRFGLPGLGAAAHRVPISAAWSR